MDVLAAIAARRTVKAFTGAPIPRETLRALCEAAVQAPNHRLTQPWRFGVADRDSIPRLLEVLRRPAVAACVEARKLGPALERIAACGGLIQVACVLEGGEERRREDRDAAAAAVQNLLLAAVGHGLGSFWSTSPLMAHPEVLRWFGADPTSMAHIGTIWLGVPAESPPSPHRRHLDEVLHWA
ncbi:MAG: nitroreductase family protein [Planctomycetes bacterium]|nr:nitroreductase family protein [Planctomycetota bacterium]